MGAREASAPLPIFLLGGLAFPKNELMLYSEYTNRSRPVRVLLASEHAALCISAVAILQGSLSCYKIQVPGSDNRWTLGIL